MYSENGIRIDIEALNETLRESDLLVLNFLAFPDRMLIDPRSNEIDGPLVAIVAPVATPQERFAWLGKHRPGFGPPKGFAFVPWPHSVRMLRDGDYLAPMRERLAKVSNEAGAAIEDVLNRLAIREVEGIREIIRGSDNWLTLWPRDDDD
jgi:hypothetical protein